MVILNPPSFLHNRTDHTAQTDRLAQSGLLMPGAAGSPTWRQGVRAADAMAVTAQGVPNMTVNVAAGQCYVNQSTAIQGAYLVTNDATVVMAIAAAHATLGRRDLVIVRVEDDFFTGAVKAAKLEVVTGVASGSPADPVPTGNFLILARITVGAAVTTITAGNITDLRPRTVALGGILPVATTVERDAIPSPWAGLQVYNAQTGQMEWYNGAAWVGAWTAYVPAVVGTAAPTTDCRVLKIGKLVFAEIAVTLTAVVTANITIALPSNAADVIRTNIGGMAMYDLSSGNERHAYARLSSANTFHIAHEPAGGIVAYAGVGAPWTWAAGDQILGTICYREA